MTGRFEILSLAERYASGAAGNRSEERAEAVGGRLQAIVRPGLPPKLRKGRAYESAPVFPYSGKRPLVFVGCQDQKTDSGPCFSVRSRPFAHRELCRAL